MVHSKLSNYVYVTPQKSGRNGAAIDRFIQHHAVSTSWRSVLDLMMGAKEVSANYIVGNAGELISVVPEEFRAWTSSSAEWDGRAITVEVCNETLAPSYTISAAAQETLSKLMADVSERYGFPLVRSGSASTVIGHRELYQWYGASYATACPGSLPIDAVTARANEIITGEPAHNEQEQDMKLIQHTDRGIGVIGAGYHKTLTGEELPYAIALYGMPVVYGLAREYDLARSIAVNGVGPKDHDDEVRDIATQAQIAEVLKKMDQLIK